MEFSERWIVATLGMLLLLTVYNLGMSAAVTVSICALGAGAFGLAATWLSYLIYPEKALRADPKEPS